MPELPHIEVFRQHLDATSLKKTVEEVEVRDEDLVKGVSAADLKSRLEGDRFVRSRRHGKYLFAETGDGPWVLFHFGMSGFLSWFEDPEHETDYPKVLWHFEDDGVLIFDCMRKLGQVSLVEEPDDFIGEKDLGPDALSEGFDRTAFREALSGRRGYLKSALMNQEIMAGVGNEFSDEILFQRKLHPKTKVKSLSDKELEAVHDTLTHVMETAVDARMEMDNLPGRIEVSGRGSYFCPACQGEEPE